MGASLGDVAEVLLGMKSPRRYLVMGKIARTRRCVVLAALDQLLAREVALKIYLNVDDVVWWSLIEEVQAVAAFDHPNIVRMFEIGECDGYPYSVMELCDDDLEHWSQGREWTEILDRVIEAGRGLAAVHEAGLVHGDVKPENIFIKGGVAKIGDFGLVARPGWSARVSGTPGYIAPEVADGRRQPAGDVFSFACAAWVCLVGQHPFGEPPAGADNSAAALVLVERAREGAFEEPAVNSRVPRAVLGILRAAMAPESEDRSTLMQLRHGLKGYRAAGLLKRKLWSRL